MQRHSSRPNPPDQELTTLKMDNQHLIQDVISLKQQVSELVKVVKAPIQAATACQTKAKEKVGSEPTPGDYVKLAEAYRRMRDKDMVDREVQALKERVSRIGSAMATPISAKRKRIMRKSVSPPSTLRIRLSTAGSPMKSGELHGRGQAKVKFVKLKDEKREDFRGRVSTELSKLRKRDIERLCCDEGLEYVTIRASAAEIADIYADRAFRKKNVLPAVENADVPESSEDRVAPEDQDDHNKAEENDEDDAVIDC
ncbi:hypothetical protein CBR_g34663 [Chara braunii]|uniref:Uncharacterized protein n=1 Tax=Chara braunii TaxID=69332 RepID=A0A388JZ37_CHABU|nr:hypothetical protein CBR_g34663 [Chara braunii]|eukprot:GBG62963.1 hypothetical protein CBR_g34663 [Chara braunii]